MTNPDPASPRISRRSALLGLVGVGVAGGLLGYRRLFRPVYEGAALTVSEAHRKANLGEIVLIDIRRPDEWRLTGVGEGAHPIDMRRDDFVEAITQAAGADKAAPIALICARGVRSARLSRKLTNGGFTGIIDVPEGMLGSRAGPGWLAAGLPTRAWSETSG